MAKGQSPMLWCILLYLLVFFITGTQSRDTGHVNTLDFHAVNGTVQILNYNTSQETVQAFAAPFEKVVDWDRLRKAAFKGTELIGVMECPNTEQSFFTDRAALGDNGWVADDGVSEPSPEPVQGRTLPRDAEAVYAYLQISTVPARNSYFSWLQNRRGVTTVAYGPNGEFKSGRPYGDSGGEYSNYHNPSDGMMLCVNNYSPSYEVGIQEHLGPVPPLNRLSDVLWYQWNDAVVKTGQGQLVKNLKWVWRRLIVEPDSNNIMETVEAFPGETLQRWPGKIYDMYAGDAQQRQIARALLGSPNGYGVAYFLAQHQKELGRKSVSKVQYWGVPSVVPG
ncbi:hypothetical protein LTR56_012725 [Elasticomyces elasticus]|nr:hypothetical protein LTR22_022990 [Elasticomyces elasticus]KAK3639002.1 hypothetical protein LTR56_012725 [Elasticomyces elasticus]KAK4918744.1 hypothetical protein LTR49_013531 [Elasticomyces elasticus]KAK5754427.1 hypothetical protein LTS12_015496 [Elasticomyces elasticus]